MALSREQAETLARRCQRARLYNNTPVPEGDVPVPLPAWVIDALVFASGGQVEAECYPGNQLLDEANITREDGRAAD